ncbi:VOC family protein [Devosia sp. CAU 1758]
MKIHVTSVFVDNQAVALEFYRDRLGFVVKHDIPLGGEDRWLTMVSPDNPEGTELLLEPSGHPAVGPFKAALVADGIPATSFMVDDMAEEVKRLKDKGVQFTVEPMNAGTVLMAVFDDNCGNLIQIVQMKG